MSRLFIDERAASIWKLTQLEELNALAPGQSRSEIKPQGLTPQEVARLSVISQFDGLAITLDDGR